MWNAYYKHYEKQAVLVCKRLHSVVVNSPSLLMKGWSVTSYSVMMGVGRLRQEIMSEVPS